LIPKETIAQIFEAARIEEVVGEFVNLKKSGQSYKGLSPFTDEKNPSFYVHPGKNIYKCFSSGKGGNAVNFLMEHEHLTYPEALRYLAKKYNIEIREEEQTEEEKEAQDEREALYQLSAFAQKYFTTQLKETEKGTAIGLKYFEEREFSRETIDKFQLGYSPDEWEAFTNYARGEGYKMEYLEKTGLTVVKEEGKKYDRFRGRVIFPIHNLSGRVIGFGARTLKKDDKIPKYLNSVDSDIYNKSKVLYGLYFAKGAIIKEEECLLVEGYTDVISMHQAGFENVVSSSGTALTKEQIRLIKRYTGNITILYDGDPAGIKASFRGIDMILEEGMNVRIVLFPENEDPDSFARKKRPAEVKEFLAGNAKDFIRFKTGLLLEEAGSDPIRRASLIREIVTTISLIPDAISRSVYVKECSSLMDISEQALMNELNKLLRKKFNKEKDSKISVQDEPVVIPDETARPEIDITDSTYQEKDLLRLLLMYANHELVFITNRGKRDEEEKHVSVSDFILEEISRDEITFTNELHQDIYGICRRLHDEGKPISEEHFVNYEENDLASEVIRLVYIPHELSENWKDRKITIVTETDRLKQAVVSALLSFKAKTVEKQIRDIQQEIKSTSDEDDLMILLTRQKELKEISVKINKELGNRVVLQ
jgi:DNA primase